MLLSGPALDSLGRRGLAAAAAATGPAALAWPPCPADVDPGPPLGLLLPAGLDFFTVVTGAVAGGARLGWEAPLAPGLPEWVLLGFVTELLPRPVCERLVVTGSDDDESSDSDSDDETSDSKSLETDASLDSISTTIAVSGFRFGGVGLAAGGGALLGNTMTESCRLVLGGMEGDEDAWSKNELSYGRNAEWQGKRIHNWVDFRIRRVHGF